MNSDELAKAIAALKKACDLEDLEIDKNGFSVKFGRDLQNHELLQLVVEIDSVRGEIE